MQYARALAAGLGFGLPVLLAGCGPMSVAAAERSCLRDADLAQGPRTQVSVGVGTDGRHVRPVGGIEIEVSGETFGGRDPGTVFASCVQRRSGELPSRPLHEQPGRVR